MRWTRAIWFVGLLLVVPAGAQDKGERMALARVAMEAQLRIGDLLHEKGDHEGALEAYRKAIAIYESAVGRFVRIPAEFEEDLPPEEEEVEEVPEEEILEEPIETGGAALRRLRPARGKAQTETAVDLGLDWLARHQDADGRWDGDDFHKHDPADDKCDGSGGQLYDVGLTGLAALAFLGAGCTDRGDPEHNPYADNVARALRFLVSSQDTEGVLGTRVTYSYIYNHAIGTLALCEAYSMTRDPKLGRPAKAAVDFIQKARNPYLAWRYEPRGGENDTSVTAWCVSALASARLAGLEVDPANFTGAVAWFDKVTEPNFGQAGYNYPGGSCARMEGMQDKFPPEKSQAMTAAALFGRILCGQDPGTSDIMRKGADLCLTCLPDWNPDTGTIDMYSWYWGTLAMFQVGGPHWRKWNEAMKTAIVKHQHPRGAGARAGSWDPIGAWGTAGGRVYSTAMMTLCLEVYYRYDRVFGGR